MEIKKVISFQTRNNLYRKLKEIFHYLDTSHFNKTKYYIAVDNGKIIGSIGLCTNDIFYDGLICNLWVADDYRRQGIASQLLETIVKRNNRVNVLRAYVCKDNNASQLVFENNGFEFISDIFVNQKTFCLNQKIFRK